ncbi:MAG: MATE family efflux transporter [Eubacteriales bacterium]
MNNTVNLIDGDIKKSLIRFAFPMFVGQLFQQLYNLADAVVVGNFVGENALAAVTNTGPLVFLMVGFFSGLFTGASVVISRFVGENNPAKIKRAIHTSVSFGLLGGLALTIVGVLTTPFILQLMGTPDSVFLDSATYIRTYFMGIIFVVMYNTACGIFQAIGDSKRPLYYLITSSIINIILDIILVGLLGMGVQGAALATVISQAISTILAFVRLSKLDSVFAVNLKEICLDRPILRLILSIGLPSGVQNSVIAFANIVVQSSVNSFGAAAMAGNGSYVKIEGFVFIPVTAFSTALTIFVSQNIGANKLDRVRKGAKFGLLFSCGIAETIGIILFFFGPTFIGIFSSSPDVILVGTQRAMISSLFYFLLSYSHCIAGIMRGAGLSKVPMVVMLACWCVIRVSYIQLVNHFIHDINFVFMAYPITWLLSSIAFFIYYKKSNWLTAHIN